MHPLRQPVPRHVARRDLQRLGADVSRPYLGVGRVVRDRDRDAAAAGADVGDANRAISLARDGHRAQHEHLGVGVGHEHARRDLEIQAHELLVADEIRDRLSLAAPRHQPAVGAQLRVAQRLVELEVQVEAAQSQRVGEKHLGVESGGFRSVLLEVVGRELQDLNDGQLLNG